LIDYAADRRAPTPTAAAELAVPVRLDLIADVGQRATRLLQGVSRSLNDLKTRLEGLVRGIPRLDAVVAEKEQALDGLTERLKLGPRALLQTKAQDLRVLSASLNLTRFQRDVARHAQDLTQFHVRLARATNRAMGDAMTMITGLAARLESVSPQRVLERGYAMVIGPDGPITSVTAAVPGSAIDLQFADGRAPAHIDGEATASKAAPKRKASAGGNQGSLF
jgi:exodeoxyribonuclease VII large subunit